LCKDVEILTKNRLPISKIEIIFMIIKVGPTRFIVNRLSYYFVSQLAKTPDNFGKCEFQIGTVLPQILPSLQKSRFQIMYCSFIMYIVYVPLVRYISNSKSNLKN